MLVSGAFQGSRDFGADTLYAAGNSDLFVTRHDATTGAIVWAENFGNEADEPGYVSIAIDAGDSFVISGMIDGKVSFGLGPQHMGGLTDTEGVFIHKRTLDNEPLWTATRLLTAPQTLAGGHSVAIDDDGRVVLVGTAAVNSADLYTIKFSATGEVYWEATHNQLGDQFGAAVAIDSTDHPIVVGRFDTDFVVDGVQIDLGDVGDIMDPFVLILQP